MTLKIATIHTTRKCRYCKTPIFIGCGFYSLGLGKYSCDGCMRQREVKLNKVNKMFNNNNGQLMNNVKVKKRELLDILVKNSIKHTNDVREALELRREEMSDYFTAQLSNLEGESEYNPKENINFPMPVDSIADYKKAVKMVEMTQDDIIELSEDQFDKLVMDNWGWKGQLATTSAFYGKAI